MSTRSSGGWNTAENPGGAAAKEDYNKTKKQKLKY
jgi:hypothetical protein